MIPYYVALVLNTGSIGTITSMYQLIIVFILLIILYYGIHNFRGWNGQVIDIPAYHMSLIRQKLRQRNAVVIHNFLTEDAKQEYDEIYETIQETDPEGKMDIIMNDTMLYQIENCIANIPVVFHLEFLTPTIRQYNRILNTKTKLHSSKRQIHAICAIQSMTVYLKNGSLKRKVELQSGDLLIVPRIEKYGFGTGTIDYFNYFK